MDNPNYFTRHKILKQKFFFKKIIVFSMNMWTTLAIPQTRNYHLACFC